jgi:hypothetical protein
MADDDSSIFSQAGFTLPKAADKPAEKSDGKASQPSIFETAGFKVPTSKSDSAPKADSDYPTPEKFAESVKKYGVNNSAPAGTLRAFREAIDPGTLLATGATNAYHDTLENAAASWGLTKGGLSDIANRNYLPTTPSVDPRTWSAGGIAKTAAGALGVLGSPLTGLTNALISRPVTEITGNPDIGDRAGVVANALLPVRGGTKAVEAVAPTTKAVDRLVDAIGPENVPEAVARLRQNPRLTVADVSDPARTMVQGLIDPAQPTVQNLVAQRVKERASSLPAAVNSAYTEAMGAAPDTVKMVEGLQKRATDAGKNIIEPALATAKPVDVTPVVQMIDKELKPGIQAIANAGTNFTPTPLQQSLAGLRNKLMDENGSMVVDPVKLHGIQSALRETAYQLSNSSSGAERLLGRDLYDFRNKLVDQIDEATGGAYKPGLQKYRDAKQINEAFESGFDTLKNRSGVAGLEDRPEAFREWMKNATPEEVVARRIGTRADIDQKIRGVKNQALAGESITRVEYNQEKLKALFGDAEASRLIRVMRDAQDEAATNAKLVAGSKTAETLAGQKALEVRKVQGGNPLQYAVPFMSEFLGSQYGVPGVGAAMLGMKGAHLGAQKIGQLSDKARNVEFARNALATGAGRETTINALLSHPDVISELKKRSNALTSR